MTTHFTSDAELESIFARFAARTLPKPEWTHPAHFAAALWLLARHPETDAETAMPPMIRAYNEATGVANTDTHGYHATITLASLRAVRAFLCDRPAPALHLAANALLAAPLGNPRWLLRYWSDNLLFSVPARRCWVGPDLCDWKEKEGVLFEKKNQKTFAPLTYLR